MGEKAIKFADSRTIYTHVQDEISKKLFTERTKVSMMGDAEYENFIIWNG